MNAKRMRLSDVANIYTGVNPKSPKTAFGEGGCSWVMVEDLKQTAVAQTARRLTPEGMKRARISPAGTIFFSRTGTIGKVGIAKEPMAPSNNIIAVEFRRDLVLPLYGMYCLAALRAELETAAEISVYRSLRLEEFRRFQIPVPDLEWQRRAAEKLEILHGAAEEQRKNLADIQEASQAFFMKSFSDAIEAVIGKAAGVDKTEGVSLSSAAELKLNGALKKKGLDSAACFYVSTPQLDNWEIPWDTVPVKETDALSAERYQLQRDDIVMNRVNQENRVGKCGWLLEDPSGPAVFAQNTLLIRANRKKVRPGFLFAWLLHPYVRQYLQSNARRSTSFQCRLTQEALTQLPLPEVPLEAQRHFETEYRAYFAYARNSRRALEILEAQQNAWYDRIRRLAQEEAAAGESAFSRGARAEETPASYEKGRYWTAPSGGVFFYDTQLECFQVPFQEGFALTTDQLPQGEDVQFLPPLRKADDPRYGELSHFRLRREGPEGWRFIRMEAAAYRLDGETGEAADLLEREGLLSEQEDFGYIRHEGPLCPHAGETAAELLMEEEILDGYSRLSRLPGAAASFLRLLSPFQQAVYEEFLLSMQPLTCHMVENQMELRRNRTPFPERGLQDVIAAVRLLENAGLLEFRQGRELEFQTKDGRDRILDHRGRPVGIRIWLWAAPKGGRT